jgi:hypothetical protein
LLGNSGIGLSLRGFGEAIFDRGEPIPSISSMVAPLHHDKFRRKP